MTSQQLFLNTRSVTTAHTASVLRVLYKDFRSEDPIVRLVMLLTIFLSDPTLVPPQILHTTESSPAIARFVDACSDEIEELELGPLTRKDIVDILLSKFVPERFGGILAYARSHLKLDADATRSIITEVALGCLEIGCKGKMLGKLVDAYGYLSDVLAVHIVKNYRIQVEDLPPVEEEKACRDYSAPLCADLMKRGVPLTFEESGVVTAPVASESVPPPQPQPAENEMEVARGDDEAEAEEGVEDPETLGDADGEDLVRGCSHPCSFLTPFAKYALMCGSAGAHWPRHTICDDPQRRNDALPPAAVSRTLYDLSRQQQVAISSWYVAKEVLPPLSEWHPGLDRSFFLLGLGSLAQITPRSARGSRTILGTLAQSPPWSTSTPSSIRTIRYVPYRRRPPCRSSENRTADLSAFFTLVRSIVCFWYVGATTGPTPAPVHDRQPAALAPGADNAEAFQDPCAPRAYPKHVAIRRHRGGHGVLLQRGRLS